MNTTINIPAGLALVPIDPTPELLEALYRGKTGGSLYIDNWKAMLKVARAIVAEMEKA